MLPSHNLRIWRSRGRGFLNLSWKGEKPQTRGTFMGRHKKLPKELTTELLCLELPTISASFGVKRYMHYIRFLYTQTSYCHDKQSSLNQFFSWIYFYLHY